MSTGRPPPSEMKAGKASILLVAIFAFIFGAVIVAEKMEDAQTPRDKKIEQVKP